MNEIEKMYMRCKIKKRQTCSHSDTCYNGSLDECEGCNSYQYPPFTAEKQLDIENVILQNKKNYNKWIEYNINVYGEWVIRFVRTDKFAPYVALEKTKAEALANLINSLWQDLTEEEKQQMKGILE